MVTRFIWRIGFLKRAIQLTETLALVSSAIDEDLATDHIPERNEHLHQLCITKLLRQVVDEEIAALRPRDGAPWKHNKFFKELTNLPLNSVIEQKYKSAVSLTISRRFLKPGDDRYKKYCVDTKSNFQHTFDSR